jgi:hypothetical protein
VAEKVSDVGVGAQGLTSADAEPSAKGNPTQLHEPGVVRRGSRFDSESVIPLLSPVSPNSHQFYCLDGGGEARGRGLGHFRVRDQPQRCPVGFLRLSAQAGCTEEGGKATALCI